MMFWVEVVREESSEEPEFGRLSVRTTSGERPVGLRRGKRKPPFESEGLFQVHWGGPD